MTGYKKVYMVKLDDELQADSVSKAREVIARLNRERLNKGLSEIDLGYKPEDHSISHLTPMGTSINDVLIQAIKDTDSKISSNSFVVLYSVERALRSLRETRKNEINEAIKFIGSFFINECDDKSLEAVVK